MTGPRLHGNGFIQWDIDRDTRLHVWSNRFVPMAQAIRTPIHDHTFSFESHVIKGLLYNKVYRLVGGDRYKVYRAVTRHGEDTRLVSDGMRVDLIEQGGQAVHSGERYTFPAGMFHESIPMTDPVITVMRKTDKQVTAAPHVLVPAEMEPDNDFDRYQYSAETLTVAVFQALAAEVISA